MQFTLTTVFEFNTSKLVPEQLLTSLYCKFESFPETLPFLVVEINFINDFIKYYKGK